MPRVFLLPSQSTTFMRMLSSYTIPFRPITIEDPVSQLQRLVLNLVWLVPMTTQILALNIWSTKNQNSKIQRSLPLVTAEVPKGLRMRFRPQALWAPAAMYPKLQRTHQRRKISPAGLYPRTLVPSPRSRNTTKTKHTTIGAVLAVKPTARTVLRVKPTLEAPLDLVQISLAALPPICAVDKVLKCSTPSFDESK